MNEPSLPQMPVNIPSAGAVIKPSSPNRKIIIIILAVIGFLVLLSGIVYFINQYFPGTSRFLGVNGGNALFTQQIAIIEGKVIKIINNKLTVESKTGKKGEVELDKDFTINRIDPKRFIPISSNDLKDIELNKDVTLTLHLIDGRYQVRNIQYTQSGDAAPNGDSKVNLSSPQTTSSASPKPLGTPPTFTNQSPILPSTNIQKK